MRSYLGFRVCSYLCTGQIAAVSPPGAAGGQGSEDGLRSVREGCLHPCFPPAVELSQSAVPL